jgi:uncharacterized membrane protein YccC
MCHSPQLFLRGLRILCACGLSDVAAWAFNLQEGYWALITAVVVMQPAFADTLVASRNRVLGTLIGAGVGLIVLGAAAQGVAPLWPFWVALALLALLTAAWPSLRMSCVTLIVVVLAPAAGAPFLHAYDRIFAILLGTLASILVAVAFPARLPDAPAPHLP